MLINIDNVSFDAGGQTTFLCTKNPISNIPPDSRFRIHFNCIAIKVWNAASIQNASILALDKSIKCSNIKIQGGKYNIELVKCFPSSFHDI